MIAPNGTSPTARDDLELQRARDDQWELVRCCFASGTVPDIPIDRLPDPIARAIIIAIADSDGDSGRIIAHARRHAGCTSADIIIAMEDGGVIHRDAHGGWSILPMLRDPAETARTIAARIRHRARIEDTARRLDSAIRARDAMEPDSLREQARLMSLLADLRQSGERDAGQTLADALGRLSPDGDPGIATGLDWWDSAQPEGRMAHGSMIVLAAPPGVGKSALVLQLSLSAMIEDSDLVVLWCAGEMTPRQLAWRALSCMTGLPRGALGRDVDQLSPLQREAAERGRAILDSIAGRMHVMEGAITPSRISSALGETGARLMVCDYLQLVRPDEEHDSRRSEVDAVLFALRRMVNEAGIVALVVSNLAKPNGGRVDASTIGKETSEIGYAADAVYLGRMETDPDRFDGSYQVSVVWTCHKQRHGEPRTIQTFFERATQKFFGAGGKDHAR